MQGLSTALIVLGFIGMAIGAIWLLVTAFRESALWGLGCLFIPIVSLVFIVMHWEDAKKPFSVWLIGFVPYVLGTILAPR